MCFLAQVSRASYYRHLEEVAPNEAEMAIRVVIQEVALTHRRRYGYRRVTADLRRRGMVVNHKRVLRILREDNLLAIRYRKYILTTDSQHDNPVYLNLAARMARARNGDRRQSTLGGGYHLHPAAGGVRLPGGGDRPVLAQGRRLGAGSEPNGPGGSARAGTGH
jgi:hypothetical protein